MKRFLFQILNKLAALIRWKWLYFLAGLALISGTQSCETVSPMCYDPVVPTDTTSTNDQPQEEDSEFILNDTTRTVE